MSIIGHPVCEPDCQCSSGSVSNICNKNDGACSCKTGFDGEKCDQCKSGFYGFPSCKQCQCNTSGSRNGNICDAQTGQCECKPGVSGHNCTKCGLNRYNFPSCNECQCAREGSQNDNCHPQTGHCHCSPRFEGTKCEQCRENWYGFPICQACNCDENGSISMNCNKETGKCTCKSGFEGEKCNQCQDNWYGFPNCQEICSHGQWTAWQGISNLCGSAIETRTVTTTTQAAERGFECQEPGMRLSKNCEKTNKIFLVTGEPSRARKDIEIVDLQGNGQQCTRQYPISVYGATGGLIPGEEGIICGGAYPITDVCHLIPSMETITMKKKRWAAASLVFNGRLLVAGGWVGSRIKSTEWVSATSPHTEEAGDMEIPLRGHSMELISLQGQPYALAIGGESSSGYSSRTFLGNLNGAQIQWTEGPPLMTARSVHASALLQHQETTYIVVSGGWDGENYLDSVEILKLTSTPSEWKAGPKLKKVISQASMVSLGTKVILLGGYDGDYHKDIYQLSSPHGEWQLLPQTLKKAKSEFVAFTIPTNWTHC